ASADGGSSFLIQLLPLVLIFAVFYFLLIRPQQKRLKEHKTMVAAVKRGDQVVTAGGEKGGGGEIDDDQTISVEIAPDITVKVVRDTLSQVLPKGGASASGQNQPPAKS
ncbi:MAG: preprotein translocase subunit YajC, partial [Rhodospirillaceae bacterium]|nr:preprotein translocase subunit YajC [Rhodospirillaceae bacterium]